MDVDESDDGEMVNDNKAIPIEPDAVLVQADVGSKDVD